MSLTNYIIILFDFKTEINKKWLLLFLDGMCMQKKSETYCMKGSIKNLGGHWPDKW